MKKRLLLAVVVLMGFFLLSASIVWAGTVRLAKTGQTTSYRTGDDGYHQKGVASPSSRFTDNGDGTVTDNLTGLMWAKNANLASGTMNWNDAIDYANNLSLGTDCGLSRTDWRLPNIRELESLKDYSKYNSMLPIDHPFTNVMLSDKKYWSSTSLQGDPSFAWARGLNEATQYFTAKTFSTTYYVWPVRGGN